MSDIEFSKDEKTVLVKKVQLYFSEELNQDIGGFDAEFLIDFFGKELGVYFYNRGVYDARDYLSKRVDELGDAILDLEKPTDFIK